MYCQAQNYSTLSLQACPETKTNSWKQLSILFTILSNGDSAPCSNYT